MPYQGRNLRFLPLFLSSLLSVFIMLVSAAGTFSKGWVSIKQYLVYDEVALRRDCCHVAPVGPSKWRQGTE
jgi:hypothetical protein